MVVIAKSKRKINLVDDKIDDKSDEQDKKKLAYLVSIIIILIVVYNSEIHNDCRLSKKVGVTVAENI